MKNPFDPSTQWSIHPLPSFQSVPGHPTKHRGVDLPRLGPGIQLPLRLPLWCSSSWVSGPRSSDWGLGLDLDGVEGDGTGTARGWLVGLFFQEVTSRWLKKGKEGGRWFGFLANSLFFLFVCWYFSNLVGTRRPLSLSLWNEQNGNPSIHTPGW